MSFAVHRLPVTYLDINDAAGNKYDSGDHIRQDEMRVDVVCIVEKTIVHRVLVWKSRGNRPLRRY